MTTAQRGEEKGEEGEGGKSTIDRSRRSSEIGTGEEEKEGVNESSATPDNGGNEEEEEEEGAGGNCESPPTPSTEEEEEGVGSSPPSSQRSPPKIGLCEVGRCVVLRTQKGDVGDARHKGGG